MCRIIPMLVHDDLYVLHSSLHAIKPTTLQPINSYCTVPMLTITDMYSICMDFATCEYAQQEALRQAKFCQPKLEHETQTTL